MLTFVTIAANSKVPISGYVSDACATLEKVEGRGMVVTRVTVHPRVTVPAGVDVAKVERLFAMAKRNCFVSNSLTGTVTVEPKVVTNTA